MRSRPTDPCELDLVEGCYDLELRTLAPGANGELLAQLPIKLDAAEVLLIEVNPAQIQGARSRVESNVELVAIYPVRSP